MMELALSDLQAAAFLHAKGFRVIRTYGPQNHKHFVFADVPDAVLQDFYTDVGMVGARRLFDSYRTILAIGRLPQERNVHAADPV